MIWMIRKKILYEKREEIKCESFVEQWKRGWQKKHQDGETKKENKRQIETHTTSNNVGTAGSTSSELPVFHMAGNEVAASHSSLWVSVATLGTRTDARDEKTLEEMTHWKSRRKKECSVRVINDLRLFKVLRIAAPLSLTLFCRRYIYF